MYVMPNNAFVQYIKSSKIAYFLSVENVKQITKILVKIVSINETEINEHIHIYLLNSSQLQY